MKNIKGKIILVIVIVFVIGALILLNYLNSFKKYQNNISNINFVNINASDVPDGSYIGEYDVKFIYAKVNVSVKDGKIIDIELVEHRNERGENAENIKEYIIEQQKINVDVIAGATNSSQVIKKAVDNAIESAK